MRDYVIVRFKCNRGALMSGDRTVYCDGHQWNSTRPDCLGSASFFFAPNSHSMLSVPPTAPILSLPNPGWSVQVGQRLTFTCRSQGGSSVKSLCSIYQTPFRRKPRSPPCLPDQQPTSGGRDRERRRDSAHDRLERASPGSSGEVIFGNHVFKGRLHRHQLGVAEAGLQQVPLDQNTV